MAITGISYLLYDISISRNATLGIDNKSLLAGSDFEWFDTWYKPARVFHVGAVLLTELSEQHRLFPLHTQCYYGC